MFWKKHRKTMILSLAFALAISSFVSLGGQAEAANAMDMFKQVYKQATGTNFQGIDSTATEVKPQPQPVEPTKPQPVEPQQPQQPQPEQPVDPQPVQPQPKPEKPQAEKPSKSTVADRILKSGEKYLGTPYKYGASSSTTKYFDCSSFVQRVYGENGIKLPRSSRQQAQVGTPVSKSELQKGDLIFTRTSYSSQISHVAIYAGNGKVLHTYGPGGVRYDKFEGSWLDRGYITARRVIK